MTADIAFLNACPVGATFNFNNFRGLPAACRKQSDGRWRFRYISAEGNRCTGGLLLPAEAARALDAASGIRDGSACGLFD